MPSISSTLFVVTFGFYHYRTVPDGDKRIKAPGPWIKARPWGQRKTPCSWILGRHNCRMKFNRYQPEHRDEVIAGWGGAKLIRTMDFNYKLVGGSQEDRAQAEKWIAVHFIGKRVEGASAGK